MPEQPTTTGPLDEVTLAEIRAREQAATPGPWGWFGNTDTHEVYLATKHSGRRFVLRFIRWGMQGAQPLFRSITPGGVMVSASQVPVYEVAPHATSRTDRDVYRADLADLRHPDAQFLASARQDMTLLLAEVDRLRTQVAELTAENALRDAELVLS